MSLRVKITGEPQEVVTIQDAKEWMNIDSDDFDSVIQLLIDSAIERSQKISGCSFWPVQVQITGNAVKEYVYPIEPVKELLEDPENGDYKNYTYEAGFEIGEFPSDLKRSVLQRVATGFAERQNGQEAMINACTEASGAIESAYRTNLWI
jgi:hypothetical protein